MDWKDIVEFLLEAAVAAVGAIVAVWRFIKGYVAREVKEEATARKTADTNIENKVMSNSQHLHNTMGKMELLDARIQTYETNRVKEMYELKDEIKEGLHNIEIQIERLRQDNQRSRGD